MLTRERPAPGQRFARRGPPLTQLAFNDFGRLLGTDAPIHVDPDYAAKTPFKRTFAQGMLLLAPFESWLCELFGEKAWSEGGTLKAKLLSPAMVGDVTELEMQAGEIRDGQLTLELQVVCNGKVLAVGEATVPLHD
jgi:acyl dehydratase